ncbi:MAG: nucleotidyltransferase domain-containing protein [Patescibacteria group bacterium]|jgi:predicted nucleotidyltransferase|nr:nucleotidyltransferase domain-containing protein [Patescibacteria group bacterium]
MINFNSKITRKVLAYFFLNEKSEMYLNEIARKFDVDRANLSRKLTEWVSLGIVVKNKKGNLSLYKINQNYPMLSEMKKIIAKSFGVEDAMKKALLKIKGLEQAFIFGSYAKGFFGPESDLDLLLVGSHDFLKTQKIISKLQKQFDREINTIDMTREEFLKSKDRELIKNIFKGKNIKLI